MFQNLPNKTRRRIAVSSKRSFDEHGSGVPLFDEEHEREGEVEQSIREEGVDETTTNGTKSPSVRDGVLCAVLRSPIKFTSCDKYGRQ
mmetsp:Transcript_9059/g.22162  ORF Transcript_9059/g.22162 Transcript_9059/m.22162 type:complete len:88 (+) Transcript_9059:179-442(+)